MKKAIFLLSLSFLCTQVFYAMDDGEMPDLHRYQRSEWPKILCLEAAEGNLQVCEYLINAGVSPNAHHPICQTPLIAASRCGKKKVMRFLLRAGADIDGQDQHGNTPLMLAAYEGKLLAVLLLLSQGANPNVRRIDNLDAMTIGGCGHIGLTHNLNKYLAEYRKRTGSNQINNAQFIVLLNQFQKLGHQINREMIAKALIFYGYSNYVDPEMKPYHFRLGWMRSFRHRDPSTINLPFLDNSQQYMQEHPEEFEFIRAEMLNQLPCDPVTYLENRELRKRV